MEKRTHTHSTKERTNTEAIMLEGMHKHIYKFSSVHVDIESDVNQFKQE